MMKKVLLLLSFLVAFFVSNAQYPIVQFLGRDSSLVDSRGGMKARLILYSYTDTASANLERISQYAGAIIYVNTTNSLWLRNATATGWSRIAAGGGGNGVSSLGTSDYGLTIQNDSTYKVDTSQVSTKLWRQKGIDSVQNNLTIGLGTKLNITDTANMRVRLYAGSNVTITGTYPNLTIASSGGGGGSQDLQSVTDLGDSTTNRLVTNDSLKAQDQWTHGSIFVGDTLYKRGDSLLAFGSSITAGSGVSTSQRFSYLISQRYGMIEANYGGGGNTIDAVYLALYKIPTKTSNRGALMFEYMMNDCVSPDTTTWKTKMQVIIDTAVARGWTKNKIIIVGGPYSQASARTYLANYVRAGQTVSETNGTQFFDAYTFMQTRGGTALTQDSVHPTALGHYVIYQSSNPAYLQFKKIGLVDVTGTIIGRKSVFAGIPPSSTVYPYNATFVNTGKASFQDKIYIGSDTTGYGNAGIVNITASSGQTGLTVKDAGLTSYSYIYGGEYWAVNSSNQSTKYRSTDVVVGSGDLNFTGSGGSSLFYLSTYGGGIFNNAGNAANFRFAGDNQTNLFYVDGTNDKLGVRTATPDSVVTILGSVRLGSTVRLSGLPTGKQAKQIYADANGTLYLGDSTVGGGGGGGTTYKIGTFNSQTPSTNGASIVSDSIYMQLFGAEVPGLVPTGGSNTTFLRGDGTWQTVSGGSVMYVDTIYRKAGQDSIFYKINGGTERAIKDSVGGGSSGWALTGNDPTSGWASGSFLGTTTNKSLLIKTNNILRARIDSAGAAGIFRLYPAEKTDTYLDWGTTANNWTLTGSGIQMTATGGAVNFNSAGTATGAFYNGELVVGSISASGITKLRIDNQSTTKSAINLSGTTLKTTPVAGDIDRDHSYLYVTLGSATRQKIATDIDTLTLTNKRITPRVGTTASSSSLTIASDSYDRYTVTALAADMTINNPSGTPTDGQTLLIRIKDNGTARALTWSGSQFRVIGVTLPTTTVISKTVYIGLIWNSADSKWDVVSVNQEV